MISFIVDNFIVVDFIEVVNKLSMDHKEWRDINQLSGWQSLKLGGSQLARQS
jgi:ABC-type cobalamin transport system ATPase subunit